MYSQGYEGCEQFAETAMDCIIDGEWLNWAAGILNTLEEANL
jgi:hypothetical protein